MRRGKASLALAPIGVAVVTTTAVIAANARNSTGAEPRAAAPPASTSQLPPTQILAPTPTELEDAIVPVPASSSAPTPSPAYDPSTEPCPPTASACVDIGAKVAWLQDDDEVTRGPVPISTGMPGHETPTGTFHVAWKAVYTKSTIYDIPMPYPVFFAAGGIAFHEGPLDESSHGCVHLDHDDAQAFFAALNVGDEVVVW